MNVGRPPFPPTTCRAAVPMPSAPDLANQVFPLPNKQEVGRRHSASQPDHIHVRNSLRQPDKQQQELQSLSDESDILAVVAFQSSEESEPYCRTLKT